MTCELPGQSMYNGYKHSYKKEHLPRARLNLAVSKDQVKLGRGSAGLYKEISIDFEIGKIFFIIKGFNLILGGSFEIQVLAIF